MQDFFETTLRPKVRVDGGDITFAGVEGDRVLIDAHADCAGCPATSDCLRAWLETELSRHCGRPVRVVIRKQLPYFAR
ncbi:MAG: NifU family protein [Lentisphaeria bacterium]